MAYPQATILGTGNLATHLAKNLEKAGIQVSEVYGRNLGKAEALASQLYVAAATDSLDLSESTSHLFFLCISDSSLEAIAHELELPPRALLIHCSGATALNKIERDDVAYGVFYPVQTFSLKRKISFEDLPICLEASSDEAESTLESLAKKMGAIPYFMNSEQRKALHLSAVFACNFTNHLYRIAQDLLADKGLPFDLLHHLIAETVSKALDNGPENAQTGPAIRKDYTSMHVHEEMLSDHPAWQALYKNISKDIINYR